MPPKQISSEQVRDRFTTYWTGPYHPDAMAYAARNGISYDYGGPTTMQFGGGMFLMMSRPFGGGIDLVALRVANRAADDEERQRHVADPNFETGHSLASNDRGWVKATRGEKLRTSLHHKLKYEAQMVEVKRRIAVLEGELDNEEDEKKREELEGFKADLPLLSEMLELVAKLNQMVEDETEAGWDWEDGLDAQKAVRVEQHAVYEKFSRLFEDFDLDDELISIDRRSTNHDPAMM